jgi:hypothetical protein
MTRPGQVRLGTGVVALIVLCGGAAFAIGCSGKPAAEATGTGAASGGSASQPNPQIQTMGARVDDQQGATGVIINQKELTAAQLNEIRRMYGAVPPKGQYWYDTRSGLYGYWGFEAAGYIRPGHDFGRLSARASRGNTGALINGREINMTEALFFARLFGVSYQGHFWLDGRTGNMGIDGDPRVYANLVVAMQQAQRASQSEYHWRDGSGSVVSSSGNCTFAAIPGAPVYSTPGCG